MSWILALALFIGVLGGLVHVVDACRVSHFLRAGGRQTDRLIRDAERNRMIAKQEEKQAAEKKAAKEAAQKASNSGE